MNRSIADQLVLPTKINCGIPDNPTSILQHNFHDSITFTFYSFGYEGFKGDYCVAVWHIRPKNAN